jgi:hypothetical protein
MITTSGGPDEGKVLKSDTIEYRGMFWLVPEWLQDRATGKEVPARSVCISLLPVPPKYSSKLILLPFFDRRV